MKPKFHEHAPRFHSERRHAAEPPKSTDKNKKTDGFTQSSSIERNTRDLPSGVETISVRSTMNYSPSFRDNQPIWWIRRTPIYLTTLLVAGFVIGMIGCTVLKSAGISTWPLTFYVGSFWLRHWFWEPITCVFVDDPSFFFLIGMMFFYQSSVEVEKYLGRKRYLTLLGILLLIPPIEQTIVWKTFGAGSLEDYAGSYHLMVGFFIAFATLYPGLDWFGWVPLKWVAFGGMFLLVLSCLPNHQWMNLVMHLSMAGAAFGCIRFYQTGGSIPFPNLKRIFRRQPKFRVMPAQQVYPRPSKNQAVTGELDALLDKISRGGMDSLTKQERTKLERLREAMMKKDQR